jgi:glycosyltransferase involved in cell wall biosynthesis
MNKKGIQASSCNIVYWRFQSGIKKRRPLWLRILSALARIPKIRGILNFYLRHRAMLKLSEDYDIIDIHFFSPKYDKLIEELKQRGKRVKVTVWGHDFYQVDRSRKEQQRNSYRMVDIIQFESRTIADNFLVEYPEFEDKIRVAVFGNKKYEIIDELSSTGTNAQYRDELQVPRDKIIITIASNGNKGHQHLKILDSIGSLSPDLKNQLFLIIPMTYGLEKSYLPQVRQKANTTGVPYQILTSFLTLTELCKYRIVGDITLTIQVSDALAAAIQEHIYTGEILIAGDWLPYKVLSDNDIFFMTTSLESLTDCIIDSVKNHQSLRDKCKGNREKLAEFSSWEHVSNDWYEIYSEIEN